MSASELVFALDAMGGDRAPGVVLDSIRLVRGQHPEARFLLFGDADRIDPLLRKSDRSVASVIHVASAVSSGDTVSQAVRRGRDTSMWRAVEAVKDGKAQAVVSAGNTGALLAIAKALLGTLDGVDRPAIAALIPTVVGESVMLDLGANVSCDARNLLQFALMGDVFLRSLLGYDSASVGLLNVGSEARKGTSILRAAADMLRDSASDTMKFQGFIEGDGIGRGSVDVIVTDGFTGNVALKAIEGAIRGYSMSLGNALRAGVLSRVGHLLAAPALRSLKRRFNPSRHNGAVFLGLNEVCVKSHGGAGHLGFSRAIGVAVNLVSNKLNDRIRTECAHAVQKTKQHK